MQQAFAKYQNLGQIGQGTYGKIFKAKHRRSGRIVALKQFRTDTTATGIPATTVREIALLKEVHRHPAIVGLVDVLWQDTDIMVVFEHCTCDLSRYLKALQRQKKSLSIGRVRRYLGQLLDGVAYCHSLRILHRDLKPQNLLIRRDSDELKIADFGLGRALNSPGHCSLSHEVVTLWYRPPEILLGQKDYGTAADIWSVGCILGEMLNSATPLFRGDSEICQIMHIFKTLGTPNHDDSARWPLIEEHCQHFQRSFPKWKPMAMDRICPRRDFDRIGQDLMAKLLTLNPQQRISAKRALRHRWFRSAEPIR